MAEKIQIGELVYKITGESSGLKAALQNVDLQLDNTGKKASGLGASLSKMGGLIAGAFAIKSLVSFGREMVKSAADMQQREAAFTTMLGSGEKAKKLMKEVADFAAKTPFELPELTEATKKLVAFGVPAENAVTTLQKIGDVASGLGIPLNDLSEIYGKAMVQGTLYAEDLNQLAGRGIPIFTELGKVMGVNASQIKDMASKSQVGFGDLQKVFENLTSEGGMFFGGMERQSKTFNGVMSTLFDTIDSGMRDVGNVMIPDFQRLVEVLGDSEFVLPGIIEMFKMVGKVIANFAGAIATAIEGVEQVARVFSAKDRKKDIAELESSIARLSQRAKDYPKDAAQLNGAIKELQKDLLQAKIENEKFNASLSGNSTARELVTKDLRAYNEMLNKAIRGESGYGETQRRIAEAGIKESTRKLALLDEINRKRNEEISKYQAELTALDNEGRAVADLEKEYKKLKDTKGGPGEKLKTEAEVAEAAWREAHKQIIQNITDIMSTGSQISSLLSAGEGLTDAIYQKRLDQIDAQLEAELRAAGVAEETQVEQAQREYDAAVATGDALDIEEKRRALTKAKIQEKYEKKRAQIEYKGALAAWEFQVAQASLGIPIAAMQGLITGWGAGWPAGVVLGPLFAGIAGGAAALQLAGVIASKPSPPKFAEGGIVPGTSYQGDKTPVLANSGEMILTQEQQKKLLNGGDGSVIHIHNYIGGTAVGDAIYQMTQDGLIKIDERAIVR